MCFCHDQIFNFVSAPTGVRTRRTVLGRHVEESLARVRGDDAGHDREVVVEGRRQDRLGGHVDEPRAWLAQQQQVEEEALFGELAAITRPVHVFARGQQVI